MHILNLEIICCRKITPPHGDWGLGIGDWGLGIGDWAQSPIPNPQYPIPNKKKLKSSIDSLLNNLN